MTEQTRGFSYTVEYGQYSSNSSAYHPDKCRLFVSVEEAKFFGLQEVARLAKAKAPIRDFIIEQYCLNCDGRGVVHQPYKRIKYKKKELKCPVCKGKNSKVKVI